MRKRPVGSSSFPDMDADVGLHTTEEIFERNEDLTSSIPGPDGNPLSYRSKKLGYIGFTRLRER